MSDKILIFGASGFVGSELMQRLPNVVAADRSHRITDTSDIYEALALTDPQIVVNCAGNKDIHFCQSHRTDTYRVNAVGAGMIAQQCANLGIRMVHISTDYAYNDPDYRTVYGASKRMADDLIAAEMRPDQYQILVCGGLYGPRAKWVQWLDGELRAGRQVTAWYDVWNYPTWIGDVAEAIIEGNPGTHAVMSRVPMNRFELFRAYAGAMGYDASLIVKGECSDGLVPTDLTLPLRGDRKFNMETLAKEMHLENAVC